MYIANIVTNIFILTNRCGQYFFGVGINSVDNEQKFNLAWLIVIFTHFVMSKCSDHLLLVKGLRIKYTCLCIY